MIGVQQSPVKMLVSMEKYFAPDGVVIFVVNQVRLSGNFLTGNTVVNILSLFLPIHLNIFTRMVL